MIYYNMQVSRILAFFSFLVFITLFILPGCDAQNTGSSNSPPPDQQTEDTPDSTVTSIVATAVTTTVPPPDTLENKSTQVDGTERLSYRIIDDFPHDSWAFTEGLVIHNNSLYETTGLIGHSSIRRVDLETGRIERIRHLDDEYFGEGLAIIDNRMIWVTWKSNIAFVYDIDTFEIIDQFRYQHEGWGLAFDGSALYLSDGTDAIHILDPDDYSEIGLIHVSDNGAPMEMINELEFIEGSLYANIWLTTLIARINPGNGEVTGWLDLAPLLDHFAGVSQPIDVLNGIAYNQETNQIYVTGKYWPKIFEIQIISSE